jgi:hypothetical protein
MLLPSFFAFRSLWRAHPNSRSCSGGGASGSRNGHSAGGRCLVMWLNLSCQLRPWPSAERAHVCLTVSLHRMLQLSRPLGESPGAPFVGELAVLGAARNRCRCLRQEVRCGAVRCVTALRVRSRCV